MKTSILLFGILLLTVSQSVSHLIKRDTENNSIEESQSPGLNRILKDISNSAEIFMHLTTGEANVEEFVKSLQNLTKDIEKQLSLLSIASEIPIFGIFIKPFILLLQSYVSRIPVLGFLLSQILVGPRDPQHRAHTS
ncbi:uncharacterized protein LOC108913946 [Anoplophora glabripennis]|uniref:uncharacterized protein LOC108913946 n=1 Tax=Anoplophora glabripennis TaxID=217634 RepID=UPI0008738B21|nr:uncharacterized protein LOC108913946 [Anoplophora glabripennis]